MSGWYRPRPVCPLQFFVIALTGACWINLTNPLRAEPAAVQSAVNAETIDYKGDVKPIFDAHCGRCHGAQKSQSGLRVDRRQYLLEGGDYGEPAIVPGDAAGSFLIQVVSGDSDDLVMPPDGNEPLSPAQIKILAQWIDQGAKMPESSPDETVAQQADLWSLQPLSPVAPPAVDDPWVANPIDAFVLRQLDQKQLRPAKAADRAALIRRLYLVMLGLLPSPDDVDRFVHDDRDDAWAQLVDRVLASPHYGERWARHWLDIVRFGETDGFETNRERPHAWRYRDWVIESFNHDKPYDQFVLEQVAGDALGQPLGTGFLVAGPHDIVKSPDINLTLMQRQDELADIINTTGTAFLGLTLGCARCHDHKFDPISQKDYYALQAVFSGVSHGDRELPRDEQAKQALAQIRHQVSEIQDRLSRFIAESDSGFTFIDDTTHSHLGSPGMQALQTAAGQGENPAGVQPGYAFDPGSEHRVANLSGGSYTWWKNQPGVDLAVYRPQLRGQFRIWLSWGCGFDTHCQDAVYLLDEDGDPDTKHDQRILATVDQQQFASPEPRETLPAKPLWSGLLECGPFHLKPGSSIILRGGTTGTVVTADLVVFEVAAGPQDEHKPQLLTCRSAVSPLFNVESFPPVLARHVRLTVFETNTDYEPCLDELEIFAGDENVALASFGSTAICSGSYPGDPKHQLSHVNDGKFGNDHSWISDEIGQGWVQIEFPRPIVIDRVQWSRDRQGHFRDRLPTHYRIETAMELGQWTVVASGDGRLPVNFSATQMPNYATGGRSEVESEIRQSRQALEELSKRHAQLSAKPQAYIGTFAQPPPTFRLHRGDPLMPREQIAPDTVRAIGTLPLTATSPEQQRRLAFARWLVSQDNPLTARVMVNRLWQYHFGTGCVSTSSDFGNAGSRPTHPQLLDWLAGEFMNRNWSMKHMHRLILLSNTWQQSSQSNDQAVKSDADTRLLWRFPPRRLEAEAIRDCLLAASGSLDLRLGGPGFSAFEVQMENVRHYFPKKEYGAGDWRRMIYMTKVRQEQDSTFGVFDCPDASQVIPQRSRSTTPLQALNLFNSQFVVQQARLFAMRLERQAGSVPSDQVRLAFRICYGRLPHAQEQASAEQFAGEHGWPAFCRALLNSNEFIFIP